MTEASNLPHDIVLDVSRDFSYSHKNEIEMPLYLFLTERR